MDRRDLCKLARVLTRLVREEGGNAAYVRMVDLLAKVGADPKDSVRKNSGAALALHPPSLDPAWLMNWMVREASHAAGVTLNPMAVLGALALPSPATPPVLWSSGPPTGVYITTSCHAAQAAIAHYTAATRGAASFTDWRRLKGEHTFELQPSRDHAGLTTAGAEGHREPVGIFSSELAKQPSGSLIAIGPIALSQYEGFPSAERLHEALLVSEFGHRIIAVVRTPQPAHLMVDVTRAMDVPEYFDQDYVRSMLRGTVELDGSLTVQPPRIAQAAPSDSRRQARIRHAPRRETSVPPLLQTRRSVSSRALNSLLGTQLPAPPATVLAGTVRETSSSPWKAPRDAVRSSAVPQGADRTTGTAPARSAASLSAESPTRTSTRNGTQALLPGHIKTALTQAREHPKCIPKTLMTLLSKGVSRRDRGLLLLGARPLSTERRLLLSETLAVTETAGPPALVLPAYGVASADMYLRQTESVDATELVCSRAFPDVPLFPSVAAAYEGGYRRMVMEYPGEPYDLLSSDFTGRYADEVCLICCSDDIDACEAFARQSAAWETLAALIGVLTCVRLETETESLPVCDAYVPAHFNRTEYDCAGAALHANRALAWESQLLKYLESHKVTALDLRRHLCAWGVLDPQDNEMMQQTGRAEGLRVWLLERALARPTSSRDSILKGTVH
jgi:hypothetical protein